MPLTIDDQTLHDAGITEHDARIELACRLYDAGKLSLAQAMRLSGLGRTPFEEALIDRGLPVYRPTVEDFESDMATLRDR